MAGLTKPQMVKGISLLDAFLKFEILKINIVGQSIVVNSGLYATQALSSDKSNCLQNLSASVGGAGAVSTFLAMIKSDSLAKAVATLVKVALPDWSDATEVGT